MRPCLSRRRCLVLLLAVVAVAASAAQLNRTQLWADQGSELAAALSRFAPFHWIGGPSASRIAAGPPFAPLPDAVEAAVIAGGTESGSGFNPLLTGNNDGIVAVGETALPGARDHLTVRALHTVIASHPESIAATISFLETGRLRRSAATLNW